MRIHSFSAGLALFLAALALPAMLHAQFQQPTPEELKMTSVPSDPGAAAVYLYREETTDDHLHYHGYYERIKVLTEKGKEQATIRIPYERGPFHVTNVQGRTIHADGTVIPLTVKPTDLVETKSTGFQVNTMVFTLPSVEVGSILEYRLDLRYDDNMVSSPDWHIQQPLPVLKAHYRFTPENMDGSRDITDDEGHNLSSLMYALAGVGKDKVVRDMRGSYVVDVTDVPATPNEDWMPPLNTLNWRVQFYYTYAHSGAEYWGSESKHWTKLTDRFINPNNQLKKTAADLVSRLDTDEKKARKIYDEVMKLDNTDFGRRKSAAERHKEKLKEIKNAEDVWQQKSGSSDDLALLFVALGRAAGLKVWPMQVVNRDRAIFDESYLSTYQLDDYIAIIDLDGKQVYLDPGQKMCPFGLLHWKHTLASGIRLSDKGAILATTPSIPYNNAVVKRVADIEIAPDGSVKGIMRVAMNGPDALYWRQLSVQNDQDEVKKQFNEYLQPDLPDGVHSEFDHFLGLDDYNVNLMAVVNITGNLGTATGKHFFVPGLFFESRATLPFVAQDKRLTPIDVHHARYQSDEVDYHLPVGFSIESLPQSAAATWPDHASLKITAAANGDKVEVNRTLAYNYTILRALDYAQLHDFYQKVATADQQQLVLKHATPATGN
jgi:hypothetical protein